MNKIANIVLLQDRAASEAQWAAGADTFGLYAGEVLAHAGIAFRWITDAGELADSAADVVVVAVEPASPDGMAALWQYAERGGTVVSYAGLAPFAARLGATAEAADVVYAELPASFAAGAAAADAPPPLRALRAAPWAPAAGDERAAATGTVRGGRPDGEPLGPALAEWRVGRGRLCRWAVDIPEAIVRIQQGLGPVERDGEPAPDGTGALDDQILKADDGFALDWELDRRRTETDRVYFAYPYADYWREAMIGHLISCALEQGRTLPFLGYWPEGIERIAHISHDSDRNENASAETTLDVLRESGVHSTWCMLEPGYEPSIYERVKAEGHELAFHYNAMEDQNGRWGEDEFIRQFEWLKQAAGLQEVTTNKNHYTCFRGWGTLFEWCERHGIPLDQTRGPSKKGNVGFLFGTCQPFFPIALADDKNRLYDVLEVGFLTQDLDHNLLGDSSIVEPFLAEAERVGGVAHFLFHQFHVRNQPAVAGALRKVARTAKDRGFVFWTAAQINEWVRARRQVRVTELTDTGEPVVSFTRRMDRDAERRFVVWIPTHENAEEADVSANTEVRFGVRCRKAIAVATV